MLRQRIRHKQPRPELVPLFWRNVPLVGFHLPVINALHRHMHHRDEDNPQIMGLYAVAVLLAQPVAAVRSLLATIVLLHLEKVVPLQMVQTSNLRA